VIDNAYRNTQQCLIWLGSLSKLSSLGIEEDNVAAMTEIIDMFATDKHLPELSFFKESELRAYVKAFWGLHSLAKSSRWRRIWTVQEAVLPSAAMVMWGIFSLCWKTFQNAARSQMDMFSATAAVVSGATCLILFFIS
jgi:hypothetical protein